MSAGDVNMYLFPRIISHNRWKECQWLNISADLSARLTNFQEWEKAQLLNNRGAWVCNRSLLVHQVSEFSIFDGPCKQMSLITPETRQKGNNAFVCFTDTTFFKIMPSPRELIKYLRIIRATKNKPRTINCWYLGEIMVEGKFLYGLGLDRGEVVNSLSLAPTAIDFWLDTVLEDEECILPMDLTINNLINHNKMTYFIDLDDVAIVDQKWQFKDSWMLPGMELSFVTSLYGPELLVIFLTFPELMCLKDGMAKAIIIRQLASFLWSKILVYGRQKDWYLNKTKTTNNGQLCTINYMPDDLAFSEILLFELQEMLAPSYSDNDKQVPRISPLPEWRLKIMTILNMPQITPKKMAEIAQECIKTETVNSHSFNQPRFKDGEPIVLPFMCSIVGLVNTFRMPAAARVLIDIVLWLIIECMYTKGKRLVIPCTCSKGYDKIVIKTFHVATITIPVTAINELYKSLVITRLPCELRPFIFAVACMNEDMLDENEVWLCSDENVKEFGLAGQFTFRACCPNIYNISKCFTMDKSE